MKYLYLLYFLFEHVKSGYLKNEYYVSNNYLFSLDFLTMKKADKCL